MGQESLGVASSGDIVVFSYFRIFCVTSNLKACVESKHNLTSSRHRADSGC